MNKKIKSFVIILLVFITSIAFSQTTEVFKFKKHKYQIIVSSGITFEQALAAVPQGWHLVTITSEAEQKFIASICKKMPKVTREADHYFIGAQSVNNQWKWITDEKWDYTAWGPGEPNGYDEFVGTVRADFGEGEDSYWKWNNVRQGTSQSRYFAGYIIEKD